YLFKFAGTVWPTGSSCRSGGARRSADPSERGGAEQIYSAEASGDFPGREARICDARAAAGREGVAGGAQREHRRDGRERSKSRDRKHCGEGGCAGTAVEPGEKSDAVACVFDDVAARRDAGSGAEIVLFRDAARSEGSE